MVARARTLEVLEDLGSLLVHIPRRCKNTAALTFRRSTHQVPVHAVGAAAPHRADPRGSLTALGTKVRYGWTFTGLRQRADGIDVQVDDPDGAHRLIRALLVISADRGRSAVRGAVEIPLVGEDYEGNFLLADVEMTSDLSDEAIHNFLAPEGTMVIETLPDGKSRIVTTDVPAAVAPTCDELEVLIHVRATTTARIASIAWMSRSRVAHRIAAAYRRGRVLLAGDAAHQHSPAGGQGMSTGIQDAVVLAEIAHAALRRDDDFPGVLAVTNWSPSATRHKPASGDDYCGDELMDDEILSITTVYSVTTRVGGPPMVLRMDVDLSGMDTAAVRVFLPRKHRP